MVVSNFCSRGASGRRTRAVLGSVRGLGDLPRDALYEASVLLGSGCLVECASGGRAFSGRRTREVLGVVDGSAEREEGTLCGLDGLFCLDGGGICVGAGELGGRERSDFALGWELGFCCPRAMMGKLNASATRLTCSGLRSKYFSAVQPAEYASKAMPTSSRAASSSSCDSRLCVLGWLRKLIQALRATGVMYSLYIRTRMAAWKQRR